MQICDYGCGNAASSRLKCGKWCCCERPVSCPAVRERNRQAVKKYIESFDDPNQRWENGHPRGNLNGSSLKGKTYFEIYGEDAESEKRKRVENRSVSSWDSMTAEQKIVHSERARRNIIRRYEDGWTPKAGRCKKIQYSSPVAGNITVDGSWELAFAKHLDRQNVKWKRNTKRFPYTDMNGKLRHYTPDFWVETWNTHIEVKGYETDLDRCKWSQFTENLQVWKKDRIIPLLEGGPDGKAADC